jgi:hypothetical protein
MAKFSLEDVIATLKGFVGLVSVALISVACLRLCGVDIAAFKAVSNLDIAALSIAAAFVSKS